MSNATFAHSTARGDTVPRHPLGSRARVLLTSVFGPYAQDDDYGSRIINPMELYHNQVTRVQHAFSLRTFNRSWGLMMIQANLRAPVTLLDFPSKERFVREVAEQPYDIVGISAIQTNWSKVRWMCRCIRKHQPRAQIVVGGHLASLPDLARHCACDHVVRADGVRWMREYLGEDPGSPVNHPQVPGNIGSRIMGTQLGNQPGDACATLIPSVGCPIGCNFCSTSAMFGGKGHSIEFYRTGSELFEIMCQLERNLRIQAFFVMDENFLLNPRRSRQLLDLMERHGKAWSLYVFASVNVLRKYTFDELVRLGISWVWMGLEGRHSRYRKLGGTDTIAFVEQLREHGIRVLGSSIIGLEEHTLDNIDDAIEHAVRHATEFHQFMLYTPTPGTPLFTEIQEQGRLLDFADYQVADIHGQLRFNYRHPHLPAGSESELLMRGFQRDFAVNGPSVVRIVRTTLRAWKRYRHHPDLRVRARFAHEAANLDDRYAGALWATREWYRDDPRQVSAITDLLAELHAECGERSRRAAPIVGRRLYGNLVREERRLRAGWKYEPPTFYETNFPDGPPGSVFIHPIRGAAAMQCAGPRVEATARVAAVTPW